MHIMPTMHAGNNKRTLKKWFIICALLFLTIQPVIAFAEPIITEDTLKSEEKPGLVEKHLSKFVLSVSNSLIAVMKAQDVTVLVFQRDEVVDDTTVFENKANASRESMNFGIFPDGLFDGVAKIYDVFNNLIPIPLFVLFAFGGLYMMFDMIRSPDDISRAKELILGVIVGVLLIRFGHLAWEWIVRINYFIVDAVYLALTNGGVTVKSFIATVWDPSATDEVMKAPSFVTAILVVCALFMTFVMNYQYMIRMIILAMLIALFPLVIVSSVLPSRRKVINTWFTEFTSQVFTQSAHAVALGLFFFTLSKSGDSGLSFWLVLAMFFALPTMADLVKRIVGSFTGEGGGGGIRGSFNNASGLGSMMAIASISRGVFAGRDKGKEGSKAFGFGKANSNGAKTSGSGGSSTIPTGNEGVGMGMGMSPIMSNNHNLSDEESTDSAIPMGSELNSTSTNTEENNERPRGFWGKGGHAVSNAGKKMVNNPELAKLSKLAAVGGIATVGAMASTMITGDGSKGAMLGAGVGLAGAKVGEGVKGKTGKTMEVGGEVVQSWASGKKALTSTKNRLGYSGKTQFHDPSETTRLGQELIGGKTGTAIGSAVGNMQYYGSKLAQNRSGGAKEIYNTVNAKRDLDWSVSQKEQEVANLYTQRQNQRKDLDYFKAQYPNGNDQVDIAGSNYNNANLSYLKAEKELRDLKQQQATFYSNRSISGNVTNTGSHSQVDQQAQRQNTNLQVIKSHAQSTSNLKQERHSKGQP